MTSAQTAKKIRSAEPVETVGSRAPQQKRAQASLARMMEATEALLIERGAEGFTLGEVSRVGKVSIGSIYFRFDSKEALFKAVIEQGILPALTEGETLLAEHRGDSGSLLRCLLLGWWHLFGATDLAGVPKLMISEANNFPELAQYYHDQVISRGRKLLLEALRRGVTSGEFRPVADPEAMVDVLIAPLLMLSIWRFSFAPCARKANEPQAFLDTHFDLILNGLRAAPEQA